VYEFAIERETTECQVGASYPGNRSVSSAKEIKLRVKEPWIADAYPYGGGLPD
jgi:hypothetical protein